MRYQEQVKGNGPYYAHVDLGGGSCAFKKKFIKMIPNDHSYYMPDHGGMCDRSYKEVDADHWIFVKVEDIKVLNRVLEVLERRYKFTPIFHWVDPKEKPYNRQKTYEEIEYATSDHYCMEVYPDLVEEGEE